MTRIEKSQPQGTNSISAVADAPPSPAALRPKPGGERFGKDVILDLDQKKPGLTDLHEVVVLPGGVDKIAGPVSEHADVLARIQAYDQDKALAYRMSSKAVAVEARASRAEVTKKPEDSPIQAVARAVHQTRAERRQAIVDAARILAAERHADEVMSQIENLPRGRAEAVRTMLADEPGVLGYLSTEEKGQLLEWLRVDGVDAPREAGQVGRVVSDENQRAMLQILGSSRDAAEFEALIQHIGGPAVANAMMTNSHNHQAKLNDLYGEFGHPEWAEQRFAAPAGGHAVPRDP